MIIKSTLSYHRLYRLFGYKRKDLDYQRIFRYLLYRISPKSLVISMMNTSSLFDDASSNDLVMVSRNLEQAKNKLPNYLGKSYSIKKMMRIEAKIRRIDLAFKEYQEIRWSSPFKKFKVWLKYNTLRQERTDLQNSFSYLEYRAKALGIGVVAYRKMFTEYAEKFSEPARFFE